MAIETIKDAVIENRDEISKNPKYCKLLIVEALFYWNKRQYSQTVKILKRALNLAYKSSKFKTVQTISYHLARVYKQWAYETKKDKYFEEAENYAKNTLPEQEKVINLSIASIKYEKNMNDLLKALKDCIDWKGDKDKDLNKLTKNEQDNTKEDKKIIITNFASWTAFTVIALLINKEKIHLFDKKVREYCSEESLLFFKEKINSQEGANIKASWYKTMDDLSNKTNNYIRLSEFYKKQAKDIT